ncbi:MAG: iron-containing alcohol dehydrogenase [Candidatus Omnitrophica bacterium]|jgi:alcohol dehydrogenase|nr:iron-containing alcohol dehydrogenase [Candidatus Omnitrophota bacterium]
MSSEKNFKFALSTNLVFGLNSSEQLGSQIKNLGYFNIGIILDQGVFNHPQSIKAFKSIEEAGISFKMHKNESVEPTYDYLEQFRKQFTLNNYDCLVGIGGGSTLDLAKGLAILLTNEGKALSYRGFPQLKNKPLAVVALPTTAGTGSEATYNAVFTDSQEKKKLGINYIHNFPVCAIIDPLFTVDCPKSVTVSSGCDALVHTLESYVHKNHTSISRIYSKEAFRLLYRGLSEVLDKPKEATIRVDLALGAYLAGIALMNSGSGPSGAFSYPLGAVYHVPHGYAGGVFIAHITKINVEKGYKDYDQLYDLIEGVDKNISSSEKNINFAKKIQELMDKLEVPRSLSNYNLNPKDIDFMIAQYEVLKAAIDQNPIEISKDDVTKMMEGLK